MYCITHFFVCDVLKLILNKSGFFFFLNKVKILSDEPKPQSCFVLYSKTYNKKFKKGSYGGTLLFQLKIHKKKLNLFFKTKPHTALRYLRKELQKRTGGKGNKLQAQKPLKDELEHFIFILLHRHLTPPPKGTLTLPKGGDLCSSWRRRTDDVYFEYFKKKKKREKKKRKLKVHKKSS